MKVFNDLYLHGYLNKNSPPMNSKKLLSMGKTLGLKDFEILDSSDYLRRVKQGTEPENCIIFIENANSRIGHFVAAYSVNTSASYSDNTSASYTSEGDIHYSDSLGSSNSKRFIDKLKSTNRKIIVHNSTSYQSDNTSNCGYLSLLFLVSHGHAAVKQE